MLKTYKDSRKRKRNSMKSKIRQLSLKFNRVQKENNTSGFSKLTIA
jgi:hypothetical protein